MAIFRKPKRGRAGALTEASAPAAPVRPRPPAAALGEKLREIAAAAAAPEDALEPALQAILAASGAQAGAICLFDARHNILRLAAESGLSDDGCRTLRSVRRGDPTSWDMPLHGLLNRRAYLIESASRNRYVPRLVEHGATVRTVACIPLYGGASPVGSVVLVAVAPKSFAERDIRTLERPLRELSRLIEKARRRPVGAEPARPRIDVTTIVAERDHLLDEVAAGLAERSRLAAELATKSGESERLRAAVDAAAEERLRLVAELERTRREAERGDALASSLAAAEQERARLAETLKAAALERAEQARVRTALEDAKAAAEQVASARQAELDTARRSSTKSLAATEARLAEHATEIARLQTRLTEAEANVGEARARAHAGERETARLVEELRAASAREQALRAEITAAAERDTGAAADDLRHALAAAHAAEEARARTAADAEAARAALTHAQSVIAALEEEASRAHAETERVAAVERGALAEQERLAAALDETGAGARQAAARLAAAEREIAELREERSRLSEREGETASLAATLEGMAAERDRLREALAAVEAERDGLAADRAGEAMARARLEEALARETAERARLASALGAAQTAVDALEATRTRRDADAGRVVSVATEVEHLVAERDRLVAERDAVLAELGGHPQEEPAPAATVEVVTVAPAGGTRSRVRQLDPDQTGIVVVDGDPSWEDVGVEGAQVVVLAPEDDLAERLVTLAPRRVIANLAAPGVFGALVAARSAGAATRFWGCIATPAGDRALALGMIEPATQPLDPDAILTALAGYTTRGTRVVTAGADVDALMSLRQALTRDGMSVSMAWDGKQASDLLSVVRPEVVVVDLGLPRRDGYAIIASTAGIESLPTVVAIRAGDDAAAGFAAALSDPAHVGRALPLAELLAASLDRSEAPPQRKQHKMRATAGAPRR
jgi:CheY-like chemotaxis protein